MTFKDLKPWIDKNGLVTHQQGVVSGNGLLYTAFALDRLGSPWQGLEAAVRACNYVGGSLHWYLPMNTKDNEYGLCSVDNFIGLALLGLHFPDIPRRIIAYGQRVPGRPYPWLKIRYHYNNRHRSVWDKSAWIGRQPQIIAALKWSGGGRPSPLEWVWWAVTVLLACFSNEESRKENWFLTYALCIIGARRGGRITRWVCSRFHSHLHKVHGSIEAVWSSYFSVADHPLTK